MQQIPREIPATILFQQQHAYNNPKEFASRYLEVVLVDLRLMLHVAGPLDMDRSCRKVAPLRIDY